MSSSGKLVMRLVDAVAGPILGESKLAGAVGQIDLDDWSWGVARDSRSEKPDAGGIPAVLGFGKLLDRASTPMLTALKEGHLLSVTITMTETAEDQFGLVVTLNGARLIDYAMAASIGDKDASVSEKWKLDYESMTLEHRVNQRAAGVVYGFRRPRNATTDGVGGADEAQLRKLALKFERIPLEKLFEDVLRDHEKNRLQAAGLKAPEKPGSRA